MRLRVARTVDRNWIVSVDGAALAAFRSWAHAVRYAHDIAR